MQRVGFAAIVLAAVLLSGYARAEALDVSDLLRRAEALVQSLLGATPVDHDVIKPPGNVDPQMALVPPGGGTLRLIAPPERLRRR